MDTPTDKSIIIDVVDGWVDGRRDVRMERQKNKRQPDM
jgi:hypothetical protein